MKKNMIKKILSTVFMIITFFILIFSSLISVSANSAAPTQPDEGSGIVFKQHEYVGIKNEILNIVINDNSTAKIEAIYTMKNTSNENLSVETMFISPVEYEENKDISVKKNGIDINYTKEFYGFYASWNDYSSNVNIDNWEEVLAGVKNSSQPFGEGVGFNEYRIQGLENGLIYAEFTPMDYYIYYAYANNLNGNNVRLTSNRDKDIVILSKEDISIETNGYLIKTQVENIYEYLLDTATKDIYYEEQMRFQEEQFNLYLYNIDLNNEKGFTGFSFEYVYEYISAITYFIDFAPNEELELRVSYIYQMGGSGYRNQVDLRYYLTPAKYWKNFDGIEINLTLSEKYTKIKSSSIKFKEVEKGIYQFVSTDLPDNELQITVSRGGIWAYSGLLNFLILVFMLSIILVPIATIMILFLLACKKNKNSLKNNN